MTSHVPAFFWPYDALDDLYTGRVDPPYGIAASPWHIPLINWRFLHAPDRDAVPLRFAFFDEDESCYKSLSAPHTWQTDGYIYPDSLYLDFPEKQQHASRFSRWRRRIKSAFFDTCEEDVGVYRTWVDVPASFLDRTVYLQLDGVLGRFEIYVNGHFIAANDTCVVPKRWQIDAPLKAGKNLLSLLLYHRTEPDNEMADMPYLGFAGLFRSAHLIAEPKVTVASVCLKTQTGDNEGQGKTDGKLKLTATLYNDLDMTVPVMVRAEIYEIHDTYDIYNLPKIRTLPEQPVQAQLLPRRAQEVKVELEADDIACWSYKKPHLYDLVVTLLDASDRIICVKRRRFGFRDLRFSDSVCHIQHRPYRPYIVRYLPWDAKAAFAVPVETYKRDILDMLRAGINTVYVQYLPADPMFYVLCDLYGLYVISQATPEDVPNLIEVYQHHPCVIAWDQDIKDQMLRSRLSALDPTRPVPRLGLSEKKQSMTQDVMLLGEGRLFGWWKDLGLDARVFEKDPDEKRRFYHAADFVQKNKDKAPVTEGVVDPLGEHHPTYFELKKHCQRLLAEPAEEEKIAYVISHQDPLCETGPLTVMWTFMLDGHVVIQGRNELPSIPAQSKQIVRFPYDRDIRQDETWCQKLCDVKDLDENAQIVLTMSFCENEATYYAEEGYETAYFAFVLSEPVIKKPASDPDDASEGKLIKSGQKLELFDGDAKISIAKKEGIFECLCHDTTTFIKGPISLAIYRAATNAKRKDKKIHKNRLDVKKLEKSFTLARLGYGIKNGRHRIRTLFESDTKKASYYIRYENVARNTFAIGFGCTLPVTPERRGLCFMLDDAILRVQWYGRGTIETYPDRVEGARLGRFEEKLDMLSHAYLRPQENGARGETRELILMTNDKKRLKICRSNKQTFSFTITDLAPEQIDTALDTEQLEHDGHYRLYLDLYQGPVEHVTYEKKPCIDRGTFLMTVLPDE